MIKSRVRDKANTSIDFNANVSISFGDGHCLPEHLNRNNYNESGEYTRPEQSTSQKV